jgi:hypothetical protein
MSKTAFRSALLAGTVAATLAAAPALAQKKYDPGASDTEIKIGQTHAVQRSGLVLRHCRPGDGRLF